MILHTQTKEEIGNKESEYNTLIKHVKGRPPDKHIFVKRTWHVRSFAYDEIQLYIIQTMWMVKKGKKENLIDGFQREEEAIYWK